MTRFPVLEILTDKGNLDFFGTYWFRDYTFLAVICRYTPSILSIAIRKEYNRHDLPILSTLNTFLVCSYKAGLKTGFR